jgi:hypothetical protein
VKDTVAEMTAKAHEISLEAGSKMAAAMKDVVNAAAGITGFVLESARDLVQYMVRRGQMTQEEADKLIRQAEEAQVGRPAPPVRPAAPEPAPKAAAPVTPAPVASEPAEATPAPLAPPVAPVVPKAAAPAKAAVTAAPAKAKVAPAAAPKPAAKTAAKKPAARTAHKSDNAVAKKAAKPATKKAPSKRK